MKHCLLILLLFSTPNEKMLAQARPPVDSAGQKFNLHFQTTYIYQYKPAFSALYSGSHSLLPNEERQNSSTYTVFLGLRLWKGAELYFNPEIAAGSGLSGAFGMAASSNGETYRVGDPAPSLYLARLFLRQTFLLGGAKSNIDDAQNQLENRSSSNYVQLLLGKTSLADIFDNNAYSNSPRTQFMNWAIMNNAAWDYAANVRGYTYTAAAILQYGTYNYKLALAALPITANGSTLGTDIYEEFSLNTELSKAYTVSNKKGIVRLLAYYNNAPMGSYRQALSAPHNPDIPDITSSREPGRHKQGLALNIEQQLSENTGFFTRLGWNDGKTETWCYTEADQSLSAGILLKGARWHRPQDNIGLAIVVDALSADHKNYLAAGGNGFELGDGKLNYGYETVTEAYYSFKPVSYPIWLSADYQFVINPGYNKDRGPVHIFSIRLHVEL